MGTENEFNQPQISKVLGDHALEVLKGVPHTLPSLKQQHVRLIMRAVV